jgi:hypothetical protein
MGIMGLEGFYIVVLMVDYDHRYIGAYKAARLEEDRRSRHLFVIIGIMLVQSTRISAGSLRGSWLGSTCDPAPTPPHRSSTSVAIAPEPIQTNFPYSNLYRKSLFKGNSFTFPLRRGCSLAARMC